MAGHRTGTPRVKGVLYTAAREVRRGEERWSGGRGQITGGSGERERGTEREMEKGNWRDGEVGGRRSPRLGMSERWSGRTRTRKITRVSMRSDGVLSRPGRTAEHSNPNVIPY